MSRSIRRQARLTNGPIALTDQATVTTNAALSTIFTLTLAASRAMAAPTNPVDGNKIIYELKQGGSGSYTITWNPVFVFSGGTAPTLTTTVGKTDVIGFIYNSTLAKWLNVGSSLNL